MYGFNEILDGVFVGSQFSVHPSHLKSFQITHILSMNGQKSFPSGFQTKTVQIEDDEDEDILQFFQPCIDFIKGNRTLVFCAAGRSRSVTIVAAYIMQTRNLSAQDALSMIREVRRINPNPGFVKQLEMWQRQVCELCVMEKRTDWFVETQDFLVVRCEQCDLPMAVYKFHSLKIPACVEAQMKFALGIVADQEMKGHWFIDQKQRSVFNHLHWHARPILFKI